MCNMKWLTPFILLFATLILLSACGTSLQKPTGLEEDKETQAENMKASEANDKKESQERMDEKEKNKDKHSEDKNEKKKSSDQKSTSDKEVNEEKKSASKSERSSPDKKDKSSESKTDKKDKPKDKTTNKKSTDKKSNSNKKENKKKSDDKKKPKPKPKEKTDNSKPPPKEEEPKEPKNTVSFSIQFSSDKVILPSTNIEFEDGDSVMKILDQITRKKEIQITILSSGYVSRIDNIGEKEHGPESGWMYRVNGIFPNVGAAAYTLTNGDVVEWLYTKDLGKDIGAP